MSRKDYVAVAQAINEVYGMPDNSLPVVQALMRLVDTLSDHFKADNDRFDRERFKAAALKGQ